MAHLVRHTTVVVSMGQDEVRVTTHVEGGLPTVQGDRERLRQVLVNLLTNAVKYTVAGDEIEVVAAPGNGSVAVSVRDHGPGIPPESQRLGFEKLGRVSQDGGGTLDVESESESESGVGATFVLQLPAARA